MNTLTQKTFGIWLLGALALGLGAACGASEPALEAEEDAISTSAPAHVTLRRDERRCISPLCGGYWIRDVNRNRAEVYVSGLDFTGTELDEATITRIQETPLSDLVIRGVLGRREAQYRTRPLRVLQAWRGLPGVTAASGDRFYSVVANDPPIQCFAAPCNNDIATLLNRGSDRSFTGLDVASVLRAFVDPAWVVGRAERHGALVAGRFEAGVRFPAGTESLLVASQVYIDLAVSGDICPLPPIAQCPEDLVNVFQRSADRCVLPAGCATPVLCPQFIPGCDEGYTMDSWLGSSGCPAFACDPTFILPTPPPPSRCQLVRCAAGFHCVDEGDQTCVPNATCAVTLCPVGTRCVEPGGDEAQCVADTWVAEAVSVATDDPYANNERQEWIYTSESAGADQVRIHFARFDLESGYDFVVVLDPTGVELARFSGRLGEFTTDAFAGSSVRIVFTTDGSVTRSGFEIDRVDSRTN